MDLRKDWNDVDADHDIDDREHIEWTIKLKSTVDQEIELLVQRRKIINRQIRELCKMSIDLSAVSTE